MSVAKQSIATQPSPKNGAAQPKAAPKASQSAKRAPAESQAGTSGAKPARAGAVSGRLTEKEVLASFGGSLPRIRRKLGYRISVLFVSAAMILLPLIYVGLIGLTGWAVWYHATHHTAVAQMGMGKARALFMLVYVAPMVIGPIVILFMIKPLFARAANLDRSRSLTRQGEPLLFGFVDRVCEVTGAPKPTRIDVDCDVNASAGFRRGIRSMLGNDLVLTIGLPLVAGLSMREFGGVLAHEFGHFSQGAGMRLSYLVRSIAFWFLRVVYERDTWDEWLAQTSNDLDIRIGWILLVAQLGVNLSRMILWVLMHIGFVLGGFLLRQMEFDADRYEVHFAGSKAFERTARKLRILGGSSQMAQAMVMETLGNRQLVDDLPGLTLALAKRVSQKDLEDLDRAIAKGKTGLFDSHPCDRDRIAAATQMAEEGIFRLERPATELFSNFAAQSQATTWSLYCAAFGPKVPRSALRPVHEYISA